VKIDSVETSDDKGDGTDNAARIGKSNVVALQLWTRTKHSSFDVADSAFHFSTTRAKVPCIQ
jgi:hypothetical protein